MSADMSDQMKEKPRGSASEEGANALEENVQTIKTWEKALLYRRSQAERFSDWITVAAASTPVLVFHLVWFVVWILANIEAIPGVNAFDPFPFPFLTMTVSLEAIFLALFVLSTQNRMARQSDKRANLDLQIDLLAEREMTAVLQMLRDIASHLQVRETVTAEQIRDLAKKTDLQSLTERMEELEEQPGYNS
jgi:uncharacterized membrane protein